jgi:hypothetical protein
LVDRQPGREEQFPTWPILCDPANDEADLAFLLPMFAPGDGRSTTFEKLTDAQLDAYRDTLRDVLDEEIASFDPHVIHAQHVWLAGHLALEAGVPYVMTAWGEELAAQQSDSRYHRYAQEAAENAGRIFVTSPALANDVHAAFGPLDGHVVVECAKGAADRMCVAALESAYRDILIARFGSERP